MNLFKHFIKAKSEPSDSSSFVIDERHIDRLARTAGLLDTPLQQVNGLDTNEQSFVAHYRKKIGDMGLNVQAQLTSIHQEIRKLRDELLNGQQAALVAISEQQLDPAIAAVSAHHEAEIQKAKSDTEQAQRMFRYFQVSHDLNDRLPQTPTPGWKLNSLIGGFILVESIILASFYADMGDNGLIGGALFAAVLASLNVALAYGLGHCIRYWNSRSHKHKFGAALGGIACLTLLLTSIAFAVQYRYAAKDQIEIVAEEGPEKGTYTGRPTDKTTITYYTHEEEDKALWVARRAFENTKLHGFVAPEVQSWWLMFSTLVFATMVVIKTYRSQDPFPGYWEAYQYWQDRAQAEKRKVQNYLTNLQSVYEARIQQVAEVAKSADDAVAKIRRLADEHLQAESRMARYLTETEDACRRSLSRYRDVKRLIATRPEIHQEDSRISFDEPRRQFVEFSQGLKAVTTSALDSDIEDRVIEIHRLAESAERRLMSRQESMLARFSSFASVASNRTPIQQPHLALPLAA